MWLYKGRKRVMKVMKVIKKAIMANRRTVNEKSNRSNSPMLYFCSIILYYINTEYGQIGFC